MGMCRVGAVRPAELTLFHTDTRKQTLDMHPVEPVLFVCLVWS